MNQYQAGSNYAKDALMWARRDLPQYHDAQVRAEYAKEDAERVLMRRFEEVNEAKTLVREQNRIIEEIAAQVCPDCERGCWLKDHAPPVEAGDNACGMCGECKR